MPDVATAGIGIVVVDDHPVFRMGMVALLESIAGFSVTGEAGTVAEAVAVVERVEPDVVVMDLQLPDGSGIDAVERIARSRPATAALMVTMFGDDDAVFAAIRAGARGYLVKGAGPEEIERAVRAVANGEVILGPPVAQRAAAVFSVRSSATPFANVTEREGEVLELLARGMDNPSIARRLNLSEKTVRNHVSSIFTKLQVGDRSQAIVKAREAGLGQQP